ncbi:MAG: hypothetical protein RBQ91_00395 [Acholeplasma sp.]|nr:hypothetical protein [Acholeplasma sp.]
MKKITVLLLTILSVFCLDVINVRASTVIEGPEVIHKAKNQVLTISDILSFYESDIGEVAVSFDEFTGNGNQIGTYNVQLYVAEGEIVYPKDIEVNVIDSLPAQIKAVGNYKDIYTNTSSELQNSTIITALESTGYIYTIQTTQMYILNNTYKANFEIPGSYDYVFRLVDSTGYDNTFSIKINVSDSGTLPNPDYIYEKPETMVSKLMNLLKTILIWSVVIISLFVLYKFFKPKVKAVLK